MKKMHWYRTTPEGGPLAEVNMTPLIDVSLVLVVILMLATPLAFESSFGLQHASGATAAEAPEGGQAPVVLRLLSDTSIQVDQQKIALKNLAGTLAPLFAAEPRPSVVVHCADAVRHGVFVQVLDVAKLSGAMEIAMAGN